MDRQANNSEILTALETVLGAPYSKIDFNLSTFDSPFYAGSRTELFLTFYIDQITMMKSPPPDVFSEIEFKIQCMLQSIDGYFKSREVSPFRDRNPMTIRYTLQLSSYDNFVNRLNQLARHKADKEFTKVLEAKLHES